MTMLTQAKTYLRNNFGKNVNIPTMTQENLRGYFKHINNFSSALCPASSGDIVLNCVAYGSRHITVFDKNPLAIYLTKLKLAAVVLQLDDFINFFSRGSGFLYYGTYLKLVDYLEDDAREFWDAFYTMCHNNNTDAAGSKLFAPSPYDIDTTLEANRYLDTDVYYQMRYTVGHCTYDFAICALTDIISEVNNGTRYNVAIFPNVMDYIYTSFGNERWRCIQALDKFVDNVLNFIMAFDGEVCYAYIHRALTGPMLTEMDDIEQLPSKLSEFLYWTFPSMNREYDRMSDIDMVIYRRKTLADFARDKVMR